MFLADSHLITLQGKIFGCILRPSTVKLTAYSASMKKLFKAKFCNGDREQAELEQMA